MKKVVLLLSTITFLASCEKESTHNGEPIIDPRFSRIISRDTLLAGNFWGINIGQSASEIYSTIQNIRTQRQIQYLGIVNNIFTNITDLETRIGLYNELILDETAGTAENVHIGFQDDKIKSIYSGPNDVNNWPVAASVTFIKKNDPIAGIYNKLLTISSISPYSLKFQRMSLIHKNILKDFDPHMSASNLWQFTSAVTDNKWWMIDLNFSNGNLVSIYATLSEY